MRVADRRLRSTFWLDDAIIDRWGPWLGRYPGGTAALAVYVVLARHAGRDAESWSSVALLARQSGCTVRTVNRALRLLELGGLVAVYGSVDYETDRQTSNTYVLLTPPESFPELPINADEWPDVERGRVVVRLGKDGRREIVQWPGEKPNVCSTPRNDDRGEGVMVAGGTPQRLRGSRARPNNPKENLEEGRSAPEGANDAFARWKERNPDWEKKAAKVFER